MTERSQPDPNADLPFKEPLIDSGMVGVDGKSAHLYTLESRPDMIIREGSSAQDSTERYEHLAASLIKLETYGIYDPGLTNARGQGVKDSSPETTFAVTKRIEGLNLSTETEQIPEEIATKAFEAILSYYEDMLKDGSGGYYLTDLSMRQCIYGHIAPATEDKVYMVDVDPRLTNQKKMTRFLDALQGLNFDIETLERTYGHRFGAQRDRLEAFSEGLRR